MTTIIGYLDESTRELFRGWIWDPARPLDPLELFFFVDGTHVASVIANVYRPDLEAAGIGGGRHGFVLDASALALPITETLVSVQCAETGHALIGSPARLPAPLELDATARRALVALLQSAGPDNALLERVQFLAQQADQLLQRSADRQSNRQNRAAARSRKWRWQPQDGPEPPVLSRRALVIDYTLPNPARDSGSNAIISHMLSLQRLGFEVTFVPGDVQAGDYVDTLLDAGIAVPCQPWSASVEEVLRRQSGEFELVYLHRLHVAQRYLQLVRHYLPKARIVYSVADLHHLRLSRQSTVEDRPETAPYVNQVRLEELSAAAACHAVLTHSAVEAALLRRSLPTANIIVVPWVIPPRPTPASFSDRSGVAFVGHYLHTPNLDAAIWLIDEIMPLVWQNAPEIKCFLAGSAMPEILRAERDPRIVPLGSVDDLSRLFDRVRLTVAPLAYGAGLAGKVANSLAAGVPCVCTPIAAEGFNLPEPLRAFVASDAAGLADAIVRLHADEAAFLACRSAGLGYVDQAFSQAVVDSKLRQAAGFSII